MRERRSNPITPIKRLLVDRQSAADLLSISVTQFDQLIREEVLPKAHTTKLGKPLWSVAKMEDAIRALMGDSGEADASFPEPTL